MQRQWQRLKDSYLFYSFRKDPIAIASFILVVVFLLIGAFAPLISPYDPYDPASVDIMNAEISPSWMENGQKEFLLGTDIQGRDLLSTMIYGLRLSALIGIGAVMLQALIGIAVGLVVENRS